MSDKEMKTEEHQNIADDLLKYKSLIPERMELNMIQAEIRKQLFDAYIKNGFSEEQSIDLVKVSVANGLI